MSNAVFQRALDHAAVKVEQLLRTHPGHLPMYTVQGKWNREGERWTHWCEGFYPGILWMLAARTKDRTFRRAAEELTETLAPRRFDRTVHDLGFLFLSTYERWYALEGDQSLQTILHDAGRTLALRQQKGGYLASFMGPWSLFIDIMMNVGIIFRTAKLTNDERLMQIALDHCRASATYLVRPDGSTAHEALLDPNTGIFREQSTQQGWNSASTWSRGLAWSLYGFTTSYRYSGDKSFLDVACRNADCWLRRCGERLGGPARNHAHIPPWDFDLPPGVPAHYDSSAAAIAASGLWDLGNAVSEEATRKRYHDAARTTLLALCTEEFVSEGQAEWEGILKHGVYHYYKNLGVDESVAWGDHFFVEALIKMTA
jgi:unsaturated chondroitin disaccharide hydrolase